MKRLTGAFAAVLLMLTVGMHPGVARAEPPDTATVRSVIDGQIAAFRADDEVAAYSFAAPSIRRIFSDPTVFMSMVKSGYQPVYRPQSVTYGLLREAGGQYIQEVFVVGPDGEAYTALYSLQEQPDGSWKISGCRIAKWNGEAA